MAKTPENARKLLEQVWAPARKRALEERETALIFGNNMDEPPLESAPLVDLDGYGYRWLRLKHAQRQSPTLGRPS